MVLTQFFTLENLPLGLFYVQYAETKMITKLKKMKTNSTHQEILLVTGTSFSTRQWCEKEPGRQKELSEREQLEEVCWNGLLYEMLPEVNLHEENKKLFVWKVQEANSFIEVELGETPEQTNEQISIDPYLFFPNLLLS